MIELITSNFQPQWVQLTIGILMVTAVSSVVVYLWLAFWAWRDSVVSEIINRALNRALILENALKPYTVQHKNYLKRSKKRK